MRRLGTKFLALLGAWGCGGCDPIEDLAPYRIDAPRILAVRSDPPQARPGLAVKREVLAVDAQGQRITMPLEFARCELPKTLGERSVVGRACMTGQGLVPIGPEDPIDPLVCQRFGPSPAPSEDPEAPRPRPTPPDSSGGYFAPERVRLPGANLEAFFQIRTRCDLLGATREVFDEFQARHRDNEAPHLHDAVLSPAPLPNSQPWTLRVPVGTPIPLSLSVSAALAQSYVIYQISRNRVIEARESLTLRWFAHGATLGRSEETLDGIALDRGQAFSNELTLGPAGKAILWIVLQDDRGATTWRQISVFAG